MKDVFKYILLTFCLLFFFCSQSDSLFAQVNVSITFSTKNPAPEPKILGSDYSNIINRIDSSFIIKYALTEKPDSIFLFYDCPYVSSFHKTGIIAGVEFNQTPFHFHYPNLSILLSNNVNQNIEISRFEFIINKIVIDKRPVLVIPDKSVNQIIFFNEGWGKVITPISKLKIIDLESYESGQLLTKAKEYTRNLFSFDSLLVIDVDSLVPFRLKRQKAVGAWGSLEFTTEYGEKRIIKYGTRVILSASATAPPSEPDKYDLFLPSGKTGYSQNIEWKRVLKKGESDKLNLSIATDKTSAFDILINIYDVSNKIVVSKFLKASIFAPRSITRITGLNKK